MAWFMAYVIASYIIAIPICVRISDTKDRSMEAGVGLVWLFSPLWIPWYLMLRAGATIGGIFAAINSGATRTS